jgi:hypothetical protein
MKATALYDPDGHAWYVSLEAQFPDEPAGRHVLPLTDTQATKTQIVAAATSTVDLLDTGKQVPGSISNPRHWTVAGPRKWSYQGSLPRTV